MATVQKTLALAPDLVQAHGVLAYLQTVCEWDLVAAEASIRRALQLAPDDAEILRSAWLLFARMRRYGEAEQYVRRAIAIDPLNGLNYRTLAISVFAGGDADEAIRLMYQSLDLAPDMVGSRNWVAIMLSAQGRFDDALAEAMKEKAAWARLTALAMVHGQISDATGDAAPRQASDQALATLIETEANDCAYQIAQAYSTRGDADAVFEWLGRAYAQRDGGLAELNWDRNFDPIRFDPCWVPFFEKGRVYLMIEVNQSPTQVSALFSSIISAKFDARRTHDGNPAG